MGGRRRQSRHVQQRAATDGDDVAVAVDVVLIDERLDLADAVVAVLHPLTAFDDQRRTDEFEVQRKRGEVGLDGGKKIGLRLGQRLVDDDERLGPAGRMAIDQDVAQQGVLRPEGMVGEEHLMAIVHLDVSLDTGHGS